MAPPPDRWVEIDALFSEALEQPPDSRRSFVATASGDPEIVAEVLSLLASLTDAESAIGESAERFVTPSHPLADLGGVPLLPGTLVGPYRIEAELGQGGMGRVYLGSHTDPGFARRVAIKVMRPDLDGEAVARRFRAERRILSALEHPHIARLYDSALTPDGQPCLVMEYIAGERIDRFAEQRELSVPARLVLFAQVCEAVAFAHRRLVIHRDLKPANILVSAERGATLLDFGIAKLMSGAEGEEDATRAGRRMLTPEYASPEQMAAGPPSAALDVYALGVVLHELLVGERPRWQPLVQALRPVAEIEAALVPPSAVAPRARARQLRGDLDTIILTALAPDPARRYPSVEALREDLDRFRRGLPITAQADSVGYRIRKFVRRNPVGVTGAALIVLLLLGGVTSTLVQARRVANERDRAERAQARAQQVIRLLTGLFESSDPFEPGRPDTLRVSGFLASGAERVQRELRAQPAVLAELLGVLGGIQRGMGRYVQAESLLLQSVALRRELPRSAGTDLGWSLNALGLSQLGQARFAAAESLFREARALYLAAGPGGEEGLRESLANLAQALMERGQLDSAAHLYDSVLARIRRAPVTDTVTLANILNNRGFAARRLGDADGAIGFIREAHALTLAALGPEHPSTLNNLSVLGFNLDRMGRSAEAVPMLREALAGLRDRLGDRHPFVIGTMRNLGHALGGAGMAAEAVTVIEEAVVLSGDDPERAFELAITQDYLAGAYHRVGRLAEAEAASQAHYEGLRRTLGAGHPESGRALASLAFLRCREGAAAERRRMALGEFERGLRVLDSTLPPSHPMRFVRHAWYGSCLASLGRMMEAERELTAQFDLAWRNHPPTEPTVALVADQLIRFYERSGRPVDRARVESLRDSLGIRPPT